MKKASMEKNAREHDENTDEIPLHSPPSGLRRATSWFALQRSAFNFDHYDHKFKWEHVTASVILKTRREVQRTDYEIQDVDGAAAEGRRHRSN